MKESSPFGSLSRTRILLALSGLEFSYPRDLARRLNSPIFAVRKALAGLERDGLVTSRLVGRTRVYVLDPSYVAFKELAAYLARLARAASDAASEERAGIQSRPQLPGSPLPMTDLLPAKAGPGVVPDPEEGWRNW